MTFEEHLRAELKRSPAPDRALAPGECQTSNGERCGLCSAMTLDYPAELALKERAFAGFSREHFADTAVDRLVASPQGRAYRAVTKRKAFRTGRGVQLGLVGSAERPAPRGIPVLRCAIEPEEHARIYAHHDALARDGRAAPLLESLAYVVLKGDTRSVTVIWNVRSLEPDIVRAANGCSKSLTREFGDLISGIFLYRGDDSGRYYLGSRDPAGRQEIRKVFGRPEIALRVEGRLFRFPPLSFSQVNASMLDLFIAGARELLRPEPGHTLVDLYCGYGLFALALGGSSRRVIGVEASRVSVAAARENARRLGRGNCRFMAADLQPATVHSVMGEREGGALAILDPPRSGTSPGVIEAVAAAGPTRVLHVFCNSGLIASDLERWGRKGYVAGGVRAFDMFPGTPELETMVLLEKRDQGIRSKGMSISGESAQSRKS